MASPENYLAGRVSKDGYTVSVTRAEEVNVAIEESRRKGDMPSFLLRQRVDAAIRTSRLTNN